MENLFVRVHTVTPEPLFKLSSGGIFRVGADASQGLPILSEDSKIQTCKRHIMEIELVQGSLSSDKRDDYQFILACDDLSLFCTHLFWLSAPVEGQRRLMLDRVELCIMIGDELLDPLTDENSAKTLTAAIKNAARKIPRIDVERNATLGEDAKYDGKAMVQLITRAEPRLSEPPSHVDNPRLRRLLEPLRVLHSIESSYIDAPINKRYWKEIQTSLSRAGPSTGDLFSLLYPAYEKAVTTYEAGSLPLAIHKLRGTLDICRDLDDALWREYSFYDDLLATGPFAGLSLAAALVKAHDFLSETLARAYLKRSEDVQRVRAAQSLAH